ncbi:MAG TPA: sigma-70 family RNA polymerase sigma factor [Planctomycetota bacterium]|nr:sigma-70 family RNA polymerase sigma factor [Planctomycetota bacterium]
MTGPVDPDPGKLQSRDEPEWDRAIREYWPRVFRYVGKHIPDRDACEDLTQSTFRGAVEGIGRFDRKYNFEQYLFGIAKNRVIDFLRRKRPLPWSPMTDPEGSSVFAGLEARKRDEETPSRVLIGRETTDRRRRALVGALRRFVQEEWEAGQYRRLAVVEALFVAGVRNKDVWKRFGLKDEVAAAGIKFRAIRRVRELLRERDPGMSLFPDLHAGVGGERAD